jgi:hypothetical protein
MTRLLSSYEETDEMVKCIISAESTNDLKQLAAALRKCGATNPIVTEKVSTSRTYNVCC